MPRLKHLVLVKYRSVFFKEKTQLDIAFLTRVVGMQDKLEQMFTHDCPNLGAKYREIGQNLWTNDYLMNVRQVMKSQLIEFDIGFDQSQAGLVDINGLFKEVIEKAKFYKQAKHFKIPTEIDDEELERRN